MQPDQDSEPHVRSSEVDPRFPSGSWVGFWIQREVGKQKMACHLSFSDGRVAGGGGDIVGRFTINGRYDLKNGRCLLIKQYENAHSLQYDGASEGDDLWFWGIWRLPGDRGGFHLWPEGKADPTERRLKAANDLPAGAKGRVSLVPLFGA
jgi:hypothetical protein